MNLDATIAKALADYANSYGHRDDDEPCFEPGEFLDEASAVRDALIAEGYVRKGTEARRVLVIPLAVPVVSPRPNQHQETP